jgi:Leucine-rich repeat (LRR) protein
MPFFCWQDVGNLRKIDLSDSRYLTELPDLSKAKNLECLKLVFCSSLTEVPSSLQYLDKLEELDVYFCSKMTQVSRDFRGYKNITSKWNCY